MLSEFLVYLRLGFEHITDVGGYDHFLFVAALTASDLGRFRKLFWLVTAFTVGHSCTLALATLDLIRVSPTLVEVLIPVTILLTSSVNTFTWWRKPESRTDLLHAGAFDTRDRIDPETRIRYLIAVGFGLIHGLGFSTFLRAALGGEQHILLPLLSFNIGLEAGQLTIVALLSLAAYLLIRGLGVTRRAWVLGVSAITGGMALVLLIQKVKIPI